MTSPYQTLGTVATLLAKPYAGFAYPEFASVLSLLSDGSAGPFAVLQSSAPPFRRAAVSWQAVVTADVDTLRGYAESKEEVTFVEEDGTSRTVAVLDFGQQLLFVGIWTVSATLVELSDAIPPGS